MKTNFQFLISNFHSIFNVLILKFRNLVIKNSLEIRNLKFEIPHFSEVGFTLVELIVSIAITIVAGYLLITILGQNNGIFLTQQSSITQGMNLNDAGLLISDSIKQASAIVVSSPTTPSFTTGINTLVLQVPSINSSGTIISDTFDYFVFAPDSTKPAILRMWVFPISPSTRKSQNRVMLTNLSTIRFLYFNSAGSQVSPINASKINFTINLKEKTGLNYHQSSSSGEVNLRNN